MRMRKKKINKLQKQRSLKLTKLVYAWVIVGHIWTFWGALSFARTIGKLVKLSARKTGWRKVL
jgi:hypothetical protein